MVETYSEARVVLAPSGELLIALPVYANQNGALFNSKELKAATGDKKIPKNMSIGIYEKFGYLMHNPDQPFNFFLNSIDLFEDLGEL